MIEEIIKYDKEFNEAKFLSKVDHIFIMILDAIMENDMSSVKHYLTDDIYQKYDELVNGYIDKGLTRLFDEMNVKSTTINDVIINENEINVIITIVSRYMDYFIDDNGEYVSGENTHRIEKNHKIKFTKKINTKELKDARRCPSCGNTLDINDSGVCPYCKQTINMKDYDYIITEIDLI